MQYLRSQYLSLPQEPGVYLFLDEKNNVLYAGKAKNLKNRVSTYFTKNISLGAKTHTLISKTEKIKVVLVGSEVESLLLEASFIKKYNPPFNVRMTYGKTYPLIRIKIKDKYPAVLIARRVDDPKSLYFGPYPNPGSLRLVLKTIRKIFPFQSVENHQKRVCLYFHLGLCPCPPAFDSQELYRRYKKNIKHIIQLLEGHAKTVLKDLTKEMKEASRLEDYEKARRLKQQIDAINLIITPIHKPFDYDVNPNLRSDLRLSELKELKMALKQAGINANSLKRVECFDISNISGQLATGSMVVFIDGEKDTSFYRRFRINYNRHSGEERLQNLREEGSWTSPSIPRFSGSRDKDDRRNAKPNDFAMMEEVLQRRIRHFEDWGKPNLIIVDGGKGQVSTAVKVLKQKNINIPVIGLAKRLETIITEDFKEINLPENSPALLLIQRIRDEAHRFAITYHRKLRSKLILS